MLSFSPRCSLHLQGDGIVCALKNDTGPKQSAPGYISGIGTSNFITSLDLEIFIDHRYVELVMAAV